MKRIAFLALSILTLVPAGFAQQPTLSERVDVNAVLIDAVVTDSAGNQMLGLTKDDFIVKENGVEQTIDSVDYFTTRRLLNAQESAAPFGVERVREERYFLFFVDKPVTPALFSRLVAFRRAVSDFVKDEMRAGDLVAIVGHDVRLKVYTDFTSDKRQIGRALEETVRMSQGVTEPPAGTAPSILRNVERDKMMTRTGTTYQALELLANSLRPIRARKTLVLLSPVLIEEGEDVRDGVLLNESRYYRPMIEALNAANVTVFAMNMREDPPVDNVIHQTLERVARETNGQYFRYGQTFRQPLREVAKASAGYYLITYRSQHPRGERGFQKVAVDVKQPEFRVKARPGYVYGE
jgi:VWFA-related protein